MAEHIGPYEIIESIGSGGMATVHKVQQPRLGRSVALKLMHDVFAREPEFRARFEREARIVAGLDHPNIVPIYDYDELEGRPYLVMRYVPGQTLKDILQERALPLEAIRRMVAGAADALDYAHQEGVLHRDMKPSNILIEDATNMAYLTDFGLARLVRQGESTMSVDTMLGTPHYMSPEQAQGLPDLDSRTDIYSLGVILYELVAGRVPFTGESSYAIVHKHIYAAPPPPSELNPELPPAVDRVLLKALEKDPAARHATAGDLWRDFETAITSSGLDELDDSRIQTASIRGEAISHHTPGGGRYVTIPSPLDAPTDQSLGGFVDTLGGRVREAISDIRQTIESSESGKEFSDGIREAVAEIREAISERDSAPQAWQRDRAQRLIQEDWSADETAIRERVNQRLKHRRELFIHALIYTIVIAALFAIQTPLQIGLGEALTSPDVVQSVGGAFLAPIATINFALVAALIWGAGLLSHAYKVFRNNSRQLEARRQALGQALELYYGPEWPQIITAKQYKKTRKQINERYERREGMISHFLGVAGFSLALFLAWPPIYQALLEMPNAPAELLLFLRTEFVVPAIITLFLMLTIILHAIIDISQIMIGGEAQQRTFQRELERERSILQSSVKPKNDAKAKNAPPPSIRLTGDGELTESYIAELDDNLQRHDPTGQKS